MRAAWLKARAGTVEQYLSKPSRHFALTVVLALFAWSSCEAQFGTTIPEPTRLSTIMYRSRCRMADLRAEPWLR